RAWTLDSRPRLRTHGMISSSWFVTLRATALAALALACAGTATHEGASAGVAPATASSDVPRLYEAQRQVEEYISSGRYDRDFSAVVARAQQWLEQRSQTAKKPAIVLDIDETSLSNWPAYRLNGWGRVVAGGCNLEEGPCGLRAWQALGKSKALSPTRELARRAHELGVAVFFISGRPPNLREPTERNLREQGYDPTAVILLPQGAHFKSAVDFKAPERRKIAEQGYTIILTMGDQESDLAGGFAERTFKLPNPVYYLP
ncbi:MAG TPA: HAD family acid phosphatase, partial [Gemmatimonadales bacterium]|nr:HAD family acid phosphatase [Gemmatimonadales bacterium]